MTAGTGSAADDDLVVDVVIHCGERHPTLDHLSCGLESRHDGRCRGIHPRTGVMRDWVAGAGDPDGHPVDHEALGWFDSPPEPLADRGERSVGARLAVLAVVALLLVVAVLAGLAVYVGLTQGTWSAVWPR